MMNNHDMHDMNVPILGGGTPRITAGAVSVFVRRLDDDGATDAGQVVYGPDGQKLAMFSRAQWLDAEEMLDEIRAVVREEIRAALKEFLGK